MTIAPAKRHAPSTRKSAVAQRHLVFAAEFIANGGNAADAARKAGYTSKGSEIFKRHPELQAHVERLRQEALRKAQVTADQVLQDYKDSREFDLRGLYDANGLFKHPKDMTLEQARQIESLDVEEVFRVTGRGKKEKRTFLFVRVVKLKLAKRLAVTDMGMRHHGLYAKDNPLGTRDADDVAAQVRAQLHLIDKTTGGKP